MSKRNKDVFPPEKRSQIMASIKGKNTNFEKEFFGLLRRKGLRFQKHYKKVMGNPDICFPSKKNSSFFR